VVDLEIGNKRKTDVAFGEIFLYFLDNPSFSIKKESFGDGLADMGVFTGLKIRINENVFRLKREGKQERAHLI